MATPFHKALDTDCRMVRYGSGNALIAKRALPLLRGAGVVPGCLHEQLPQVRVAGFGDAAPGGALSARVLGGNEPKPAREGGASSIPEACGRGREATVHRLGKMPAISLARRS